jgi:hypothetical protein
MKWWHAFGGVVLTWLLVVQLPIVLSYVILGRGQRALDAMASGEAQILTKRIQRIIMNGLIVAGLISLAALWWMGRL